MRFRRFCVFLIIMVWLSPSRGEAQAEAQAQAAFLQGQQLAEQRDFAGALEQYREASRLAPNSPAPLLGMGLCLTELGQNREALDMLDRYLDRGQNPQSRRQAEEAIDGVLRPLGVGTIRLTVSPSNASVTVDGQEIPTYRLDRIRVNRGEHSVVARASGYSAARQQVQVRAGQTASISLSLSRGSTSAPSEPVDYLLPDPEPTEPQRVGVARQWWFWTIVGAVVVGSGLAVGLTLGLREDAPEGDWRLNLP
jgi:hypothetical protein